ncbi:cytochrome P450 oxidoreductase GliC [Apiospora kogelbergensis]|uniref:Cytochrome P450 oxidoreductase GliC n=1 Tax=Apiospora kogelbergensis TaxID=1337665 RepID=A0AAW0QE59_9PEZI
MEKFLQGRANSAKWRRRYGELYRLWAGTRSEVVLTKAAHVQAVFRDSHTHIKAHANGSGYLMDCLLGSCLGLISGGPWRTLKSRVEAPFLHPSMGIYTTDLQDFTGKYLRELGVGRRKPEEYGKLHPVHDLKLLPFLFVARILYGALDAELEAELLELIPVREQLFKSVIAGGVTRFYLARLLAHPTMRSLDRFKNRWATLNDKAHSHAAKTKGQQQREPPIIDMYKSVKDGAISREQLLQTLDEMLFANIDVTMGGVSWALVFLAAHPTVQKALREEIRDYNSSPATRDAYLLSSWSTKPTLLGACILEAARLRPLAAFSVPQSCPTPRTLDGFLIPARTDFIVDTYALNIRDPFWGPDRDRFRPQRWLERQQSGRDLRYHYWRFGFGPRTCLGKHIADLMLRTLVVNLLEGCVLSLDTASEYKSKSMETEGEALETGEEDMNWPWDDEMWIHHPDLLLRREPL